MGGTAQRVLAVKFSHTPTPHLCQQGPVTVVTACFPSRCEECVAALSLGTLIVVQPLLVPYERLTWQQFPVARHLPVRVEFTGQLLRVVGRQEDGECNASSAGAAAAVLIRDVAGLDLVSARLVVQVPEVQLPQSLHAMAQQLTDPSSGFDELIT